LLTHYANFAHAVERARTAALQTDFLETPKFDAHVTRCRNQARDELQRLYDLARTYFGTPEPPVYLPVRKKISVLGRAHAHAGKPTQIVRCVGADDMTRGQEAAFLTQFDKIDPIDPRRTKLVRNESGGYGQAKLFLEAQLRQMPLTDPDPDFEIMSADDQIAIRKRRAKPLGGRRRRGDRVRMVVGPRFETLECVCSAHSDCITVVLCLRRSYISRSS